MLELAAVLAIAGLAVWLAIVYRRQAMMHPGSWFCIAWLVCIGCYTLADMVDAVPIHDYLQLEKLWTYLLFTSGLFFTFSLIHDLSNSSRKPLWLGRDWENLSKPLLWVAGIGFAGAMANTILLGTGFHYSEATRQTWLAGIPTVTARCWYLYMATYPAAFVTGVRISSSVLTWKKPSSVTLITLFLTMGAGALWMIGTGGRQAFGLVLLHMVVGAGFGWARMQVPDPRKILKRCLIAAAGLVGLTAGLAFVINYTGSIRAEQQSSSKSRISSIRIIGWGGQFFDYMGQSISTFQAYGPPRSRNLSDTGPVTFGMLDSFGVGYLMGWRPIDRLDTNPERAFADSGMPLAYGTRNIFYDLEADFGFTGELVALIVLVGISDFLFTWTVRKRGMSLVPLMPLAAFLMFWGYSHQFSLFMADTTKWTFFSYLMWDLTVAGMKSRRSFSLVRVRRSPGGLQTKSNGT